jgi:hypothetical protein
VSEKDKDVKKRVVIAGYDPRFLNAENKIEVVLYENGAMALLGDGRENFIYLYKSQRKKLEKLLGTAGSA